MKQASTYDYDYFVSATGLQRAFPVVPRSFTRKQYLLETEEQVRAVSKARNGVVVIGGGAVGIEMAAELKMVKPDVKVTLVHSRAELLSSEGLLDECKHKALELLLELGVEVLLEHRVTSIKKVDTQFAVTVYELEFTDSHKIVASCVVMAVSKGKPSTDYLPPSVVNSEGYVIIEPR